MNELSFFESVGAKLSWCARAFADPANFDAVALGRTSVLLALVLYVLAIGFGITAQAVRDRSWVIVARRSVLLAGFATFVSAVALVVCFVDGAYHIQYVHRYSERALPLAFKISGLWAGLDGSILFWAMLVGGFAGLVAWNYRKDENHPVARRMEPNVYVVLAAVQLFFLVVIAFVADPFLSIQEALTPAQFMAQHPDGPPTDGAGLNPQLVSYWMQIHPPCLYMGFVIYTIPFAFGMAALVTGEQGAYWVKKTRRWMLAGWLFNTCGIILGGLWAYEVLGWGGYWAWDPVENASFLPWFCATAFLHTIMLQERRDMARNWNVILVWFTFLATLLGTYLTRSGVVSSVHAFASGSVGHWFLGFMLVIWVVGAGLIATRFVDNWGRARVESLFSRECIFVINNVILIALALAILVLTIWPKITQEYFGQGITVSVPVYNFVTTPFFICMLFLTAVGPSMGWVRSTPANLAKNLVVPVLVSFPIAAGFQLLANFVRGGEAGDLTVAEHIYPTFLVNYAGALILTALTWELHRTARSRVKRRNEGYLAAITTLLIKNNRRYGGYTVHIGLAILSIGIVNSSMFKVKREKIQLSPLALEGQPDAKPSVYRLGDYEIEFTEFRNAPPSDDTVLPYLSQRAKLSLFKMDGDVRTSAPPTILEPEIRLYPQTRFRPQPQRVSEPAILRAPLQDVYAFFQAAEEDRVFQFDFHRNPLMGLVWLGWLTLMAGAIWAALPMGRKRVGLAD